MGLHISRLFDYYYLSKKQVRVLMLGFDSVGKTTILYQLKLGKLVHTIPTIGFNIETVEYKNISFTVWDVGGQGRVRAIWRHYYRDTNAIIFVVDSSDRDNHYISIVREELYRALNEPELHNIPLLVLADKKDIHGALTTEELTDKLGLRGFRTRAWKIQATCATSGEGLYEGLEWLSVTLRRRGP